MFQLSSNVIQARTHSLDSQQSSKTFKATYRCSFRWWSHQYSSILKSKVITTNSNPITTISSKFTSKILVLVQIWWWAVLKKARNQTLKVTGVYNSNFPGVRKLSMKTAQLQRSSYLTVVSQETKCIEIGQRVLIQELQLVLRSEVESKARSVED